MVGTRLGYPTYVLQAGKLLAGTFFLTCAFYKTCLFVCLHDTKCFVLYKGPNQEREAKSLEGFKKTVASITTMRQMHFFLFSKHMAYASKRLLKDRDPVDPKTLQTY